METATPRETTHLIKKMLREKFGIDARVKSDFYSMGCSINIDYVLGPDVKLIEGALLGLQSGHFNGMEDIYEYTHDRSPVVYGGKALYDYKHVFISQDIGALYFDLGIAMSSAFNFDGVPMLTSPEQLHLSFPNRYGNAWTWKDMVYQNFIVRHFVTNDPGKIKILSCHWEENACNQVYFIYEVDGVQYKTNEPPQEKSLPKSAEAVGRVETMPGEVKIIKYSEKAIAVVGDTKPIKDTLKGLGGWFKFGLSCGPGWIFPAAKLESIQAALKGVANV